MSEFPPNEPAAQPPETAPVESQTTATEPAGEPEQTLAIEKISAEELSPQELAEAKDYGRKSLLLALVDMWVDFAFLLAMALVIARPLDAWLANASFLSGDQLGPRLGRLLALYVIVFAMHVAASGWLSFYRGYVLEHEFKLSNQSLGRWFSQFVKSLTLVFFTNALLFAGLYFLMWLTGPWWWLATAVAFFAVAIGLGYLAPILILPLFMKYEPLDDEALAQEIATLAEGTGINVEGVYRLNLSTDTKKANAMLAGLGRTRRVLLGDTLLENFTLDEIKIVMAHELGHHVYKHIYKMLLLALPYSLVCFWLCDRLLALWIGPTYDPAVMPGYAMPMIMLFVFVLNTISMPLQNGLMRHFERQCDWYALSRTNLVAAYRAAFTKLARLNKGDPDPPALEVFFFEDHPPIKARLAMADRFAEGKR